MAWEIRFEFEDDFIIKEKAGSCESPFLFDLCLQQYLRISLRAFWAGDSPTEVHMHILSLKILRRPIPMKNVAIRGNSLTSVIW